MSVNATYRSNVTAVETFTTVLEGESLSATHNSMDTITSLTASTVPPITTMAAFTKTLVAGAATIDLRALTGTNGAIIDGNGLKIQLLKIQNPLYQNNGTTPNDPITIAPGASNGYKRTNGSFIFHTGGSITLNAGEEITWCGIDHANVPDIAASVKTIDLAGTGTEESNWTIIMG